ncbi:MAG: hypothetical protein IT486_09440 [Gammaproteobacteria bacterium]|nr:hypothetical protein [Gammaproteobacteria bacterium]
MIIGFTTVFAILIAVLGTALLTAAAAIAIALNGRGRARRAEAAAEAARTRAALLEGELAAQAVQLETLVAAREHERAAPGRPSLREAVALSRHGASTEELVATCRIGQGEARLIQMLYGSQRTADAESATAAH